MLKIAFHIAISPHMKFYSRIKWLRRSLDYLGEPYNKSVFHISLSNENNVTVNSVINSFQEFKKNNKRYRLYLVDGVQFRKFSFAETAGLRYNNIDDSDITVFCDADILFINRIDELINYVMREKGIYGVIAHYSPFSNSEIPIEDNWNDIAQKLIGEKLDLKYNHSLKTNDKCPAYYNFGFVIGDKESWNKIKNYAYDNFKEVFHSLPSDDSNTITGQRFFCMQVSLSLVLHKFRIKTHPVSEIYNCANESAMLSLINNEVENICIIHYLRNNVYDRDNIFMRKETIQDFLNLKDLDPVSVKLQETVKELLYYYEPKNKNLNQSIATSLNRLLQKFSSFRKKYY